MNINYMISFILLWLGLVSMFGFAVYGQHIDTILGIDAVRYLGTILGFIFTVEAISFANFVYQKQ